MAARVGMVGAVPVCPPERSRSDVSIRKRCISMRKHFVATFACTANDGCALVGRAGRHTGTATTTLDNHIPTILFII